jgi:F0F1-type ATP synthase assembly protein I
MSDDPRIDDVAEHIREIEAKAEHMPSIGSGVPMPASRIGIDFTISVLGGALLGWLVDLAVPSIAPWPLIGMIIAGFISGLLNMWGALSGERGHKPGK